MEPRESSGVLTSTSLPSFLPSILPPLFTTRTTNTTSLPLPSNQALKRGAPRYRYRNRITLVVPTLLLILGIVIYRNAYISHVYSIEVVVYHNKSIVLKSPFFVR